MKLKSIVDHNRNSNFIIISILITSIYVTFENYSFAVILVLIGLAFIKYIKEEYLLFSIVFSIIATSGETFASIRTFITAGCIFLLVVLFVRKYGLSFQYYPKIPVQIIGLIFLYFLSIVLSTAYSNFQIQSISAIIRSTIFFGVVYIFYTLMSSYNAINKMILAIIIASCTISITIYFQILQEGLTIFIVGGYLARYTGAYQGHNFIGLIIMVSTMLSFIFLLSKKNNKNKHIFFICLVINNFIILLLLNSRLALVGTILGIMALALIIKKKLFTKILISLMTVFVLLLILPGFIEYFQAYIRIESISERYEIWEQGFEMALNNKYFGVGPTHYSTKVFNYYSSDYTLKWVDKLTLNLGNESPHNFFLLMTSENGILGLLASSSIFILFFYFGIITLKNIKVKNDSDFITVTIIMIIGIIILVRSFYEVDGILNYGFLSRDIIFWLLFSLIIKIHMINIIIDKNKHCPEIYNSGL